MKIYFLSLLVAVNVAFAQKDNVVPLGPSGGTITLLEGSINDDVVLAVVRDAGVYRSIDGGEQWQRVALPNFTQFNLEVYDFAFHPIYPDSILMATSFGLFASGDKGATWNILATAVAPSPRYSIEYTPANPNILFGSDDAGVLRSNDGGRSWIPLKDGQYFGNRSIKHIAIHPSDVNNIRLVATTDFWDSTGVFLSTNGGLNWRPFNKGLPPGEPRRIYAVEMDSTGLLKNDFRIVIGTAHGMYAVQTNYADTNWLAIEDNNHPVDGVITAGTLVYDKFDTVANEHQFSFYYASNSSEFDGVPQPYLNTDGLFKISSMFGTILTISPLSPPPVQRVFSELTDITSIHVPIAVNKSKIYIGTTNGVFISYDAGVSWQRKNQGIFHTLIRNMDMLNTGATSQILFSGIFGGGVIRSFDNGKTWLQANTGLGNPYVTTVKIDQKNKLIYAGNTLSIFRSSDAGNSWAQLFAVDGGVVIDSSKLYSRRNEMTIRISPRNPDMIMFYSGAYGLRMSTDRGSSWSLVKSPVAVDTTHVPENIEFDPVDSLTIYYTGLGIFKSTDLGKSWQDISSNLPKMAFLPAFNREAGLEILSPTINPHNNKEMFVSLVFSEQKGTAFRLFKTIDGGFTWDPLATQIPSYDVEYDFYEMNRLVASGPFGIARTIDGGATWAPVSDTAIKREYYLLSPNTNDPNVFYAGSEIGGQKITLVDYPNLSIDTVLHHFGTLPVGNDSTQTITLSNKIGLRSVFVHFEGLTDTNAFKYLGPIDFKIPAGSSIDLPVRFIAAQPGMSTAVLRFTTSDVVLNVVKIVLTANTYLRFTIDKLAYDFGSVTVGKDSAISITIDNAFGLSPISLSYLGNSDTVSFQYIGQKHVLIDTGKTANLDFRFSPKIRGEKIAYLGFSTSDPRFPIVKLRFQGTGVSKNYVNKRVLFDTATGFVSYDGSTLGEYFKLLKLSLDRAGINVDLTKRSNFSSYDALLYVQPQGKPPAELVDSLQRYVMNGGTLAVLGDAGPLSQIPFNSFLEDSSWKTKYNIKTGIHFNSNALIDTSFAGHFGGEIIAAVPPAFNPYTYKIDTVVLKWAGSLTIDSALISVKPLLVTKSKSLFSEDHKDTTFSFDPIQSAIVAAMASVGKGKIIAVSDYDIWWNGYADDTLKTAGLFAGDNLQFALNIFGLVDNLLARLPEPTPQEEYKLISIPYSFADSSVQTLFKNLGEPNQYVWRMFGRWNDRKKEYEEFPKDFKTIRRGEGYWLITKQPTTIDFGTTTIQGSEDDFEIVLAPGYNLIGNPFPYRVSWYNSKREAGIENVIWKFNKAYDSTSFIMEPFTGYFIKNRDSTTKKIWINSEQVVAGSLSKENAFSSTLLDHEWKIRLKANTSHSKDENTFVGMLHGASEKFDDNDFSKPPVSPGEYVSVMLKNGKEVLAADYRPMSNEGDYWDFTLSSSVANEAVTLSFDTFGEIPQNFGLYLVDFVTERIFDVTTSLTQAVTMHKNESARNFRFVVGNRSFLEKSSSGIPIVPLQYLLEQNFPNPFNPSTSIKYSLSHSASVKLEIFNVLGQKVKTIVNSFQPIGEYIARWDGTDNFGRKAASGVYYYRIEANEFTAIKKMTLIK